MDSFTSSDSVNSSVSGLQVTTYTPESPLRDPAKLVRDMLADAWGGRGLAWRLFIRDVSAKYRQTMLGYVWAFLPPVATTFTFVLLNAGGIINVGELAIPYAAFVMIGTLLWQVFVDAIQSPIQTITASKAVLIKINLPREAILISGLLMVGFNFMVRLILLIAVFVWFQLVPPVEVFLLPIGVLGLALLGFMIGLILTPIGVLYQDIGQSLPIITSLWLFLTPVVYPPRTEGILGVLSTWNPVSPMIQVSRDWITVGNSDFLLPFMITLAISFLLMILGWITFRLAMPHLIARLGG